MKLQVLPAWPYGLLPSLPFLLGVHSLSTALALCLSRMHYYHLCSTIYSLFLVIVPKNIKEILELNLMCNIFHGFEFMFVAYFNVNYYWTIPLLFGYHVKEGIMSINICIIFLAICRFYIVVESTYYERDEAYPMHKIINDYVKAINTMVH